MNNPYFSVGEEVLLVSKNEPEMNGDYTVLSINFPDGSVVKNHKGKEFVFRELHYSIGAISNKGFDAWGQSALRKKPDLSDESFSDLMRNYTTETV